MKKTDKILLTDINADRDRENALLKYQKLTAASFENYATIKLSMNLFTMFEMSEDISLDRRDEIEDYIDIINMALRKIYVDKEQADAETIKTVTDIRDSITRNMKILTFYTDALEVYEYILNRKEPALKGFVNEDINLEQLANNMFEFVFSEDDTMLINSRIKDFTAQLPVRMSRDHFFNIIETSIALYKGSEKRSVLDYTASIRDSALINIPEGIEEAYPDLYKTYVTLRDADYINLDEKTFDELTGLIKDASESIQSAVTNYLMLTEIINDVLVILYTNPITDKGHLEEKYEVAAKIIGEIVSADDIYEAADTFDKLFIELEGVQESSYEDLAFLAGNLDELKNSYYEVYDEDIKNNFDSLNKADRLTSTSLFMDIDESEFTVVVDEADEIFIKEETDELINDIKESFKTLGKMQRRSIMAKILAQMPVFFNSKEEIHEYFSYALNSCADMSELTACEGLINELMG